MILRPAVAACVLFAAAPALAQQASTADLDRMLSVIEAQQQQIDAMRAELDALKAERTAAAPARAAPHPAAAAAPRPRPHPPSQPPPPLRPHPTRTTALAPRWSPRASPGRTRAAAR